jgi:hypothetical protein
MTVIIINDQGPIMDLPKLELGFDVISPCIGVGINTIIHLILDKILLLFSYLLPGFLS